VSGSRGQEISGAGKEQGKVKEKDKGERKKSKEGAQGLGFTSCLLPQKKKYLQKVVRKKSVLV